MKGNVSYVVLILVSFTLAGLIHAQDNVCVSATPYACVNAIADDGNCMWIGTEWGLTKIDKATEDRAFLHERLGYDLPSEKITALTVDSAGTICIATDCGSFIYGHTEYWHVYDIDMFGSMEDKITSLAFAPWGPLWIGTDGGGAVSYGGGDGTTWLVYDTANSDLPSNTVNDISVDVSENIWLGTSRGLARFDGKNWVTYTRDNSGLPDNTVICLSADDRGNVWIGTQNGLARFEGDNWTVYEKEDFGLPTAEVSALAIDRQNIWLGNDGGIARFDGDNWISYTTDNSGLPNNNIISLAADTEGKLWVGTSCGLIRFDGINWDIREMDTLAGKDTWTRAYDMPTSKGTHTSSVVNEKIYIIGGYDYNSLETLSVVEEYDPATDSWTTKTVMPTKRFGHYGGVVNGKIYAIGGVDVNGTYGISTVEEYDPDSDSWTTKPPLTTPRWCHGSCAVNGKIYVIGGVYGPTSNPTTIGPIEEYDPGTGTCTTKKNIPTQRGALSCCAVNGKIYAIGGAYGPSNNLTTVGTVEEYNPVTDTWTTKSPMPTPRGFFAACEMNGKIYAIGGYDFSSKKALSIVEEYDPETDIWTSKLSMPVEREDFAACAKGGKIYVFGGENSSGICASEVYVYNPIGITTFIEDTTPIEYKLWQNYPNPFNLSTTISYRLNQPGMVSIVIYDLLGRKVETLVDEIKSPGSHTVTWHAEGFASGLYFCRIRLNSLKVLTQKMMLMK